MKLAALGFLAALTFATSALAHVEPGIHKGTTADGKECSMVAGETYFEKNTPHPLNERIKITVDGTEFIVGHPPIINAKEAVVFFNHDVFQGLSPTSSGAKAIEIEMEHTEQFEGPKSFTFIENAWRAKTRVTYTCSNLKHQK